MKEYGNDHDWDHADFGPGFDWDSWEQPHNDVNIDEGMAWQFAQWLTQADEICPLMNLLQLGDLGLPNYINLQDECRFQASQLAGFVQVFASLPSMNHHYSNKEWANYMCDYVTNMISDEMSRYGFKEMSHAPHWANDACSCLTNIFMDAAEGNFNVMNLGMCAMNVQSLIQNAMTYDFELKAYAPEAIAKYVVAIGNYITENEIVIDWNNENFGKLFYFWGIKEFDLTNVESVYNAIAYAWAWNVAENTGATLGNLFDLLINVDTYLGFIQQRIEAFGVNYENEFEVGVFLSDENNREKLLDFSPVDSFIFGLFEGPEFVNKLNVFSAGVDLGPIMGEGWSVANWVNANLANWGQEGWTHPSVTAHAEIVKFLNEVVMIPFAGLDWSLAFVLNFIGCVRFEILIMVYSYAIESIV